MALPTNRVDKVKLSNNVEYEIIPKRLTDGTYEFTLPTVYNNRVLATTLDIPATYVQNVEFNTTSVGGVNVYKIKFTKNNSGSVTNLTIDTVDSIFAHLVSFYWDYGNGFEWCSCLVFNTTPTAYTESTFVQLLNKTSYGVTMKVSCINGSIYNGEMYRPVYATGVSTGSFLIYYWSDYDYGLNTITVNASDIVLTDAVSRFYYDGN